jgi:hypothetical protein
LARIASLTALLMSSRSIFFPLEFLKAFSSEVASGSREENASNKNPALI